MKYILLTALLYLGVGAFAQEVQFDYARSANFTAYKTYQWVDYEQVALGDQLLDQDIKRAVDEQLTGKGLRLVPSRGDLLVGYQARISEEKQFDAFGSGFGGGPWGWGGPGWGSLDIRGATSTIEVGKLVIGLFDPAAKQLVWRGSASKTLDLRKDPDKNYRTLERRWPNCSETIPQARASAERGRRQIFKFGMRFRGVLICPTILVR